MGWFDWFTRQSSKPRYPNLLEPEKANTAFFQLIEEAFHRQNLAFTIDVETASIECDGKIFGLVNLAQICAQHAPLDWPTKIEEHFRVMQQAFQMANDGSNELIAWDDVKDRLGLILYEQKSLPPEVANNLSAWIDLPGVVSVLVRDESESTRTIPKRDSDQWDVPNDQIKQRAVENSNTLASCAVETIPIGGDTTLYSVVSDEPYAATSIYWLDEVPNLVGPYGTFVGIPTRFQLLAIPIDKNISALVHVPVMASLVEQSFTEGPRSVSPFIFYRSPEGEFEEFSLKTNAKEVTLQMPRLLAARLSSSSD
jgi:hypothetical protein